MELNFQKKVFDLHNEQVLNWPLAKENYETLRRIQKKEIKLDEYSFFIQYNPERIRSTTVCLKSQILEEKKCFLCPDNLPPEQKYIPFENDFRILCNPYPVFSTHLTIVSNSHIPQSIKGNMKYILEMAKSLPKLIVFYNGPNSGASAPLHLHFQAGNKKEFPIYVDFDIIKKKGTISSNGYVKISQINDYGRNFLILESNNLGNLVSFLESRWKNKNEPEINLLVWYENELWVVCLFDRKQHRPSQFYATGEEQIIISPAAVELAGLIITPRKEDFDKLTKNDIIDIFKQVLK